MTGLKSDNYLRSNRVLLGVARFFLDFDIS